MNVRRAALYLQIPAAYCRSFGGFRWAQYGEAVEFLDGPDAGRTFAFAPEIARFLEGLLTAGGPPLAFGCVLHLLYLIGLGERAAGKGSNHRVDRIAQPFRDLKSPLRNAGALCAWLCRDIRGVADPPELCDVLQILNGGSWIPQMVLSHPMLGAMDYAEQPGLEPFEFAARVARELDTMSDRAIRHWLKHGRGPVGSIGDRLVPFPSRDLAGSLSEVERRPRLAGAALLISRLEGALSLPPRRLDRSAMQTDGYSDLTTRGSPEQILPIQFALEDEEFLRRFAERELLYFHREVPRQPAVEEIALLLDQGVRTWGDVRLVLASAAMALARQAVRRRIAIRLATTGNGGEPVDLARLGPGELVELLEASDLSPHPGRMLARLLQASVGARRDVVLLTHPRSLGEPDVGEAARLSADDEGTRLFAVSVDSRGQVELAELRRGWPVVLGRSRVDLGVLSNPMPSATAAARLGQPKPWSGHLELIPFPFRCGLLDGINTQLSEVARHMDFDEAGEWILVAGRHGLLTACRLDGVETEVLPQPIIDGQVMRPVRGVIGVAGGCVLVGDLPGRPVLAHYDFLTRTCTLHRLEPRESAISWSYYADLHAVAGHTRNPDLPCLAVDLAETGTAARATSRAKAAIDRADARLSRSPLLVRDLSDRKMQPNRLDVSLDARTGSLKYRQGSGVVRSLMPLSDGRPALKGTQIAHLCQGGDVLAMRARRAPDTSIVFVSLSRAAVLGMFTLPPDSAADSSFALSRDGRRFARRLNDQQVEVRDVPGDRPAVFVTSRENVWRHFASLGRSCLLVSECGPGNPRRLHAMCLIRWDRGRLEVDHQAPAQTFQELGGVIAESRGYSRLTSDLRHDLFRFQRIVDHGALRILIDQYNHLAVLGRDGELIGMFYVSEHEFAAWTSDGTRLGSIRLIGGESTPHAAERMARLLRSAEQEDGGRPMTVQVSFELRRRSAVGPATALFVPTRDASVLLAICARRKLDLSGRVFDVAGGFLLELERPTTDPVAGATRLRELAGDFYLPVDAELVPALLDDEAAGLVRDGGLVFLPGGRILRFDRRAAVELARLVKADPRPRRPWAPMPEPRRLADRLAEIAWESADVPPEALYQEFEQDLRRPGPRAGKSRVETEPSPADAETDERPGDPAEAGTRDPTTGGTGADVAGETSAGGLLPGIYGLAEALRGLANRAGAGFSAFQEKIQWEWIDHSALVRKLLREFREGDPSRALLHAFSMAPADPRHRVVGWGNRLPWNRAIYNLLDLLGRPARGQPVGIWHAQPGLVEELTREYRKAAEQAIRDGDFRRAAYIYGRLLGDDRMAAQSLQRGGLHRDAAILYWKKLNDLAAAAQAFEAAGAADKAIELYRELGRHEAAGDLLRRIGEEDAAVAEYRRAAQHATSGVPPDYYHAGLILVHKARRADLAVVAFQAGWDRRPGDNATLCALELALIHADRGAIGPIRELLDEADALFRSVGSDREAAALYNTTALLVAGTPALAPFAEEVRDRALLALAGRLAQDVHTNRPAAMAISSLFGEASLWSTALVGDAHFAANAAQRRSLSRDRESSAGRDPRLPGVQVGRGTVTAAAQASATSELFLAFDNGKVISFRPGRNQIVPVAEGLGGARALAVDAEGQAIVALRQNEYGARLTCSLRRPDGTYQTGPDGHFPTFLTSWITPILRRGADRLVGLGDGIDLIIVEAASWMPRSRLSFAHALGEPPTIALLLPAGASSDASLDPFVVLTHDGPCRALFDDSGRRLYRTGPTWCPAAPGTRPLHSVPFTWTHAPPFVDLIGLDKDGALYASEFHLEDGVLENLAWRVATTEGGYLAATRAGLRTAAAVSRTRIDWLSYSSERFQPSRSLSSSSFSSAVACFPALSPQEVLVVFNHGFVARLDFPRRGTH